ncbi:hypothetical protein [Novosphingobium soli]|uniref:OmpR/PhoB-type domain-containing protein n=1 Tax=Novosphingobium soli TaxID=574956 RepID=A0ABV6CVE8_9SPHN
MTALCPHCRGDISEDAAIRRGPWWLHPAGAFYDGNQVNLSRAQARVLYAIARADGRPVKHHNLPGCGEGTLAHHVRMIRKATGERFPITGSTAGGFSWAGST